VSCSIKGDMNESGWSYSTLRRKAKAQVEAEMRYIFDDAPNTDTPELSEYNTWSLEQSTYDMNAVGVDNRQCCFAQHSAASENPVTDDTNAWLSVDTDADMETSAADDTSGDEFEYASSDVREQLADWAAKFNVSLVAIGALLSILKPHFSSLPLDPRTLLRTPRDYAVKALKHGGDYCHLGLMKNISLLISAVQPTTMSIELQFNIDGLPVFRSSSMCLWPILCMMKNVLCARPFVIGIYCGTAKPGNAQEFLEDFVTELRDLIQNGMIISGKHYTFNIHSFVCDAPARAFIKGIKGHSGYNACEKCVQVGEYHGKVIFPVMDAPLRTDAAFDARADEDHHTGECALRHLDVGCV